MQTPTPPYGGNRTCNPLAVCGDSVDEHHLKQLTFSPFFFTLKVKIMLNSSDHDQCICLDTAHDSHSIEKTAQISDKICFFLVIKKKKKRVLFSITAKVKKWMNFSIKTFVKMTKTLSKHTDVSQA